MNHDKVKKYLPYNLRKLNAKNKINRRDILKAMRENVLMNGSPLVKEEL